MKSALDRCYEDTRPVKRGRIATTNGGIATETWEIAKRTKKGKGIRSHSLEEGRRDRREG